MPINRIAMEEQGTHARRKQYDPQTYARLLDRLTQLMNDVPKLRADRDAWDIEGDWSATGVVHFVDKQYQLLFEPLRNFDCRSIKLVNPDQPAVRMTFYRKHRYDLIKDKDLPIQQKVEQLKGYISDLIEKAGTLESKLKGALPPKIADIKSQISRCWEQVSVLREILAQPGRYEIALSNYGRQHMYVTVNYKYRLPTGEYANAQEHLLNSQRDKLGNITQVRYNILFVDPDEIVREHPYQNREVENYLKNFPIQSEVGRYTLYARLKPENDPIDSFNI